MSENTEDKQEMISLSIKRNNNWVLEFEDKFLPVFLIKSAHRPKWSISGFERKLDITLYDPVFPSMSHLVVQWLNNVKAKNASLKLFDEKNKVIEEWKFINLIPEFVDFGHLNYFENQSCEIKMYMRFEKVELLNV